MTQQSKHWNDEFFAPGINPGAVRTYFDRVKNAPDGGEIHTLAVWKDGKQLLRVAAAPYHCTDKREIHSLSKIFSSTAIGFLYDDGLVDLQDKIVDIFRDRIDYPVAPGAEKMTLRHVLAMSTGHSGCILPEMIETTDVVKAFLQHPLDYGAPGCPQRYSTAASCILGAVVTHLTGMSLMDFMECRLFYPLGMEQMRWCGTADGHAVAGAGLRANLDDILKLGRLYLQQGQWEGRQILSADWVRLATSEQSWNGYHDSDFSNGYGLHWWRCYPDGFRGDGAVGQLCLVYPAQRAVVALQGYMEEMGVAMRQSRALLEELFDDVQPAEPVVYAPLPASAQPVPIAPGIYRFEENAFGWTQLRVQPEADGTLCLQISDGTTQQMLRCGNGVYTENTVWMKKLTPKLLGRLRDEDTECVRLAACWGTDGAGTLRIGVRFLSSVYPEEWELSERDGVLQWDFCNQNTRREDARSLRARKLV